MYTPKPGEICYPLANFAAGTPYGVPVMNARFSANVTFPVGTSFTFGATAQAIPYLTKSGRDACKIVDTIKNGKPYGVPLYGSMIFRVPAENNRDAYASLSSFNRILVDASCINEVLPHLIGKTITVKEHFTSHEVPPFSTDNVEKDVTYCVWELS